MNVYDPGSFQQRHSDVFNLLLHYLSIVIDSIEIHSIDCNLIKGQTILFYKSIIRFFWSPGVLISDAVRCIN